MGVSELLVLRSKGASLAEVLIAVFVLVFVILGMLAAVVIAKGVVHHKELEDANHIASHILETFEAMPYEDIVRQAREIDGSTVRGFVVRVEVNPRVISGDDYSSLVKVEVAPSDGMTNKTVAMSREVSAHAWQNAGELPAD